jgi:hypothetical protein
MSDCSSFAVSSEGAFLAFEGSEFVVVFAFPHTELTGV